MVKVSLKSKLLLFSILLIIFMMSNFITTMAATTDGGCKQVDDGIIIIEGTNPPAGGNPWLLSKGPYNFSFDFGTSVYSNTTFQTSTGTIRFTITSSPSWEHQLNDTFTFHLIKRGFFNSEVGSIICDRDGTSSGSFRNLDTNAEYYFWLSKAEDGVVLTGDGKIYE